MFKCCVNIFNGVIFRKILLIFFVGLISRILVNYIYDINVFRDCLNTISLIYYSFIACFSGFISDIPKISFSVLNFNTIKNAIVGWGDFFRTNKMMSGDTMFVGGLDKKELPKNNLVFRQDTSGRQRTFKSAALRGLYGDPQEQDIVSKNHKVVESNRNLSYSNKFKSRLLWPLWKHFSDDYHSYKEYSESFISGDKKSIRGELKKIFSKK